MELFVEDDNASNSSDDSFAVLPDLRPYTQDVRGPNSRTGRAHSALRRDRPGGSADKIPLDISRVDLAFQYNNKTSYKSSGTDL